MATIQVDDSIMRAADSLFADLGLDTSTAVKMFLTASLEKNGIPFAVKRNTAEQPLSRETMFGCLRGQYKVPDDFNDPIDDFADYMQ